MPRAALSELRVTLVHGGLQASNDAVRRPPDMRMRAELQVDQLLRPRRLLVPVQGWDISIMQFGFSKASFGRGRHHRRLERNSYGE
jgi:hypothetical protein